MCVWRVEVPTVSSEDKAEQGANYRAVMPTPQSRNCPPLHPITDPKMKTETSRFLSANDNPARHRPMGCLLVIRALVWH